MTANNPYSGVNGEHIAKYQADQVEERILHMQTNDPLRTPTYSIFPVPDYFFGTSGPNVAINNGFAYDHGYYSPNIDVTWVGFAGAGVAKKGVDGPGPVGGNESQDPNSTHTVPQASQNGTWVEETDIRPTMLQLLGLKDDYERDGHVVAQALENVPRGIQATEQLAAGYDQIESSVGPFATDTLLSDTAAIASGSSSDDGAYQQEENALLKLANDRDAVVAKIKAVLNNAPDNNGLRKGQVKHDLSLVNNLLQRAAALPGA
jgi:hypothetical protein